MNTSELLSREFIYRKYFYAGGTRIAMRLYRGGTSTLYWLLSDHRGLLAQPCSQSITANTDGSLNSEVRYTAFGETRYTSANETPIDYLYTGQRIEEEAGLYYYNARWYDPYLNHFVQADTAVPHPGFSLSFIRYAYVYFNPVRYTDPTGHMDYPGDGGYDGGGTTYGGDNNGSSGGNNGNTESITSQPKPDKAKKSLLTEQGCWMYDLYTQMFNYSSGWWWWAFDGQFTIENFLAGLFYYEGNNTLASFGNFSINGLTLIEAFSEGSVRAYYGWYYDDSSKSARTSAGPETFEGLLNWMGKYGGCYLLRIAALTSGNNGGDMATQFQNPTSYGNAMTVANNFFNPQMSWKVPKSQSLNRPYGWGNNKEFYAKYAGNADMVAWYMPENFIIPTGAGDYFLH